MLKGRKLSYYDSYENQHCLVCNVPVSQHEEEPCSIFSKLRVPDHSHKISVFVKIGQILKRALSNINMHSDIICHSCFALVTDYITTEKKLIDIHTHLVKSFDDTALAHDLSSASKVQESCRETTNKDSDNNVRIINEEGELVIVEERDVLNSSHNDSKEEKFKQMSKRKESCRVNGTISKPFTCPVCRKDFRAKSHCVEHMLIHLGEKPWSCSNCNKPFRTKSALRSHVMKHTGERPYRCEQCDKSFVDKCYLEDHIRVHSGEKPFVCDSCNRHFTRKKDLVVHIKIHTDDKPYICMQCPKRFAVKSRLQRHSLTHSGEKSFVCEHCEKSFIRKDCYKIHVRQHTGERPFKCSFCDKTFTHSSNRLAHMRTHTSTKKNVSSTIFYHKKKVKKHFNGNHTSKISEEPNRDPCEEPVPVQEPVMESKESCLACNLEHTHFVADITDLHTMQPMPVDHEPAVPRQNFLPPVNENLYTRSAV